MTWKEIRQNGEVFGHVAAIWQREQKMPPWFISSSQIWTRTESDFRSFVADCGEIHGLFDGERLTACVYVEKQQDERIMAIHLSVLDRLEPDAFVAKASELRNMFFHRGIRRIRGWTLRRNFALVRLMSAIGFRSTNFKMDHGAARGQVLRWELMEVCSL